MPVKGIAIVLAAVLTVPNTSVALDQPITARILTATFMAVHANDIILTPNRSKQKKNVYEVPGPIHCHQRSTSPVRIC